MTIEMATGKFFQEIQLPEQKSQEDGVLFPMVLSPNAITDSTSIELSDFEEAIRAHKPWLEYLLQKRGVILFRGFNISSPSDFNNVVEAFGFPEMHYASVGGRASRTKVVGRVYTANEFPPDKEIPFHHEMAYMKERHPAFVAKLEEHGLTYIKLASETDDPSSFTGTGWKTTYNTDDKKVAEERTAKQGTKLEWIGDVARILTRPMPAIRSDEKSGKKTWFNSLILSYSGPASRTNHNRNSSVELGNGETVPDDAMEYCLKILDEECVAIPWKKGDFMIVNNLTVLHGRRPLLEPPRRILVSLCHSEDGVLFPVVLCPNPKIGKEVQLTDAIKANKEWLDSLLYRSGAILFRGFPVFSASDFNDVVESSGYENFPYDIGGAGSRTNVVGRVYTANEAPPDQEIPFHHEMSHAPVYPSKLFFFCEVEPGSGGETCIALSHLGMKLEWVEGGVRVIIGPKPGSRYDETRKRKIWFNKVTGGMKDKLNQDLSKAVMFSDGKPVPADVANDSSKIFDEECIALQWRKGDVLLLDNLVVMHSRRPLTALPRRVLASFCK
ncbi:Taurine catabolism dioxygenase TauD/TfdA [Cynara cardunculus var. scolymus]|uniref:Taurine catabolism dioxygenase TauD/TfdA n=1 Tax=Cynara cardunculus var. scolymus TaxID=59895 RepID=A0A103YBB6_CYNCS|nr:Taurine catabolism dioxygenase TauD/TfdA [Cynara cardunculus var. scolymus]